MVEIIACDTAFLHLLHLCSQSSFCHLLNPSRLYRQYGQKQLIMGPLHDFELGSLTQNFLNNLVESWPRRTILRHIDYDGDLSTDDQYKECIQMQQTEKDNFIKYQRTKELQTSCTKQKKRRLI